jgi:tetraacyldisaccharide 4'-kinase
VLETGAALAGRRDFTDHYPYDAGDLRDLLAEAARLRALPVTTLKDWVRIPEAFRAQVTVLPVELEWEEPAQIETLLDPLAARVPVPA